MIALALADAAASVRRVADPGTIARHAEAGGERAMAHRHALEASAVCAASAAWDDALVWLDMASACADSPEEVCAADEATARLMSRAGWSVPPERHQIPLMAMQAIVRDDMDLQPEVLSGG